MADRNRRQGQRGRRRAVQQAAGAIGYVEQAYALQHKFTYASVKNKAGSSSSRRWRPRAPPAKMVTVPANLGIKVINSPNPTAYPITSQTFIVVKKDLSKAGTPGGETAAKGVAKFLEYGLGQGQSILAQADYAALPASILSKSKEAAGGLECNGAKIGG